MLPIDAPAAQWANVLEVFEATLAHEQEVTRRINELVRLAKEEKDFATDIFLHWFVSEQVEEEETVKDIISKLRLIKEKARECSSWTRTWVPASLPLLPPINAQQAAFRPFSGPVS